jgi:hypothetical protein
MNGKANDEEDDVTQPSRIHLLAWQANPIEIFSKTHKVSVQYDGGADKSLAL